MGREKGIVHVKLFLQTHLIRYIIDDNRRLCTSVVHGRERVVALLS